MRNLRSVTAGGSDLAKDVAEKAYQQFVDRFPTKLYWFVTKGYRPHEWQAAFHSANFDGTVTRFRHLVAGRRGGKTLSAAWEVVFYCLHPEQFHADAHGRDADRPLWVWVLAKDHEVGFPARQAVQQALDDAKLVPNKDYKWNKTEKKVEFANGTLLQFKSADDPQSLRGAGLDILWIDEAAFVPNNEAWNVVSPALSDKIGLLITTTTPKGRNWFYDEFFKDNSFEDDEQFHVEYTSIDNPYFTRKEWEAQRRRMHPVQFAQEFLASFNAMQGIELHGDWLHYYTFGDTDRNDDAIKIPLKEGVFEGRKYLGVDPASSLSDKADHFAMCLIGITRDNSQAFVIDTYKGRVDFPDQLDLIREWFLKYRPEYIGIEANAYQRVLAQQAVRMDGLPPVVPVISRGKKWERIMAMAPVFKIGKVRILKEQRDFIEEWVNYDSALSNPKDDLMDATEIALSAAGVLLPAMTAIHAPSGPKTLDDEAREQIIAHMKGNNRKHDPELGSMA